MAILCGADGCKKGWVLAIHDLASGDTHARRASSIGDIFDSIHDLAVLAIDVPIGLPDAGPRACDIEARAMLGRPRGSSVFPAPIRPMLSATSYPDACSIGRRCDGRGLPVQCWHIVPKIREVDTFLRESAGARSRTREIHPEISFMLLADRPMSYAKRKLSAARGSVCRFKGEVGRLLIDGKSRPIACTMLVILLRDSLSAASGF